MIYSGHYHPASSFCCVVWCEEQAVSDSRLSNPDENGHPLVALLWYLMIMINSMQEMLSSTSALVFFSISFTFFFNTWAI